MKKKILRKKRKLQRQARKTTNRLRMRKKSRKGGLHRNGW